MSLCRADTPARGPSHGQQASRCLWEGHSLLQRPSSDTPHLGHSAFGTCVVMAFNQSSRPSTRARTGGGVQGPRALASSPGERGLSLWFKVWGLQFAVQPTLLLFQDPSLRLLCAQLLSSLRPCLLQEANLFLATHQDPAAQLSQRAFCQWGGS